ncbi:hypothetical protein BMAGN_1462 [Bifidobacterium magnum]|uniref:Uncharacterized protein n=1 Tax=Bifidobacterium magnum TaxID=1692 RepID=A0A087B6A3_9BIFI|nr:hypothetical protein BMAGN_1462 [Bifidobacterium magnum]
MEIEPLATNRDIALLEARIGMLTERLAHASEEES